MRAISEIGPNGDAPRRAYARVEVTRAGEHFQVGLDGRVPRTPGGRPLLLPSAGLAELTAEEWRAQGERIVWSTMLATRLAYGALDAGPTEIKTLIASVARLAQSDLLCYRAEAPRELARRQGRVWDPLLAEVEGRLGVHFTIAKGVIPVSQSAALDAAVDDWLGRLDPFRLVPVEAAARLFGSAILAIAMAESLASPEGAFTAATLDETFQEESWGRDSEAEARREALRAEASVIGAVLLAADDRPLPPADVHV